MRRTFSTLMGLCLFALSLSVALAPASAGDDDGHQDRIDRSDDHDDDGGHASGECDNRGAANLWTRADSRNWTWENSRHSGFGYWLGLVLNHHADSEDDDCESPDAPNPDIPDDLAPPVVIPPVVTEPVSNPPETPTSPPIQSTNPPAITPEQPPEPPSVVPTEPPIDTSVGGATETNPGDDAALPGTEAPSGGQQPNRPAVVRRVPAAIPRLSVSVDCSARVVATELSNVGDAPGLVDVFLVTESVRTGIDLPVGAVVEVDFPIPDGAEGRTLSVIASDGDGIAATNQVMVDCESSAVVQASIVVRCQANVIDLTLSNRGEETALVDVLVERTGRVARVDLAGGQTKTVEVDTAGRSTLPLRVVVDGDDVLRSDIAVNCPQPSIEQPKIGSSASVSCVTGEILVNVWNSGGAAGIVAISSGGSSLADIPVSSGSVIVAGLPLDRSQTMATVSVTDKNGTEMVRDALPNPCVSSGSDDMPPCSSVVVSTGDPSSSTLISTPSPGEPWWVDAGPISAPGAGESGLSTVRSCADPSADFVADCGAGSLQVVLSNSGSISTRLAILIDGDPTGSTVDVSPGQTVRVTLEIGDASRVAVVEAGRVEPLTTLEIDCGSGRAAPRTAYAVFAFSIGGSLLAMVGDPRKLWFLVK